MDSLNDIRLTNQMLIALYGQSLVAPIDHTLHKPVIRSTDVVVKFLGGNEKRVTIIVNSPGVAFLPDAELNFLTKMLEACRMNIADVAIVNLAEHAYPMTTIRKQLAPHQIIYFGTNNSVSLFSINENDGLSELSAPTLKEMISDLPEARPLKSRLWASLKQLFSL